jgi:hypothetical protein
LEFRILTHNICVEKVPAFLRYGHVVPEPIDFLMKLLQCVAVNLSLGHEISFFIEISEFFSASYFSACSLF